VDGKGRPVKRPTIADIARRAGVTKAAVSFALNNQPGVSAGTRERILAIAEEVGFEPSSAARALSDGRAGAFGLVIDRPAQQLGIEPYFMQLMSGIQAELSAHHVTLLCTLAEDQQTEIALYRKWWGQRRVDGVFLVDMRLDDDRVAVLQELKMPGVVIGTPLASGSLPAVWQDDRAATQTAVAHLAELGHRRIGRVTGIPRYWHTKIRTSAFQEAAAAAGIEVSAIEADYTGEFGAKVTRELLSRPDRPSAILYDNDVMAVAGLGEAQRMGVQVPRDLSIVAWDDSMLCELVHPAITALHRDVSAVGVEAARRLSELAAGDEVGDFREPLPQLIVRESTSKPSR
jgi:DNA-binding LacI/PurR family transcriptional regulator